MKRTVFYAWVFTLLVVLLSTLFILIRRGFQMRVALGFLIVVLGFYFLKKFKEPDSKV